MCYRILQALAPACRGLRGERRHGKRRALRTLLKCLGARGGQEAVVMALVFIASNSLAITSTAIISIRIAIMNIMAIMAISIATILS